MILLYLFGLECKFYIKTYIGDLYLSKVSNSNNAIFTNKIEDAELFGAEWNKNKIPNEEIEHSSILNFYLENDPTKYLTAEPVKSWILRIFRPREIKYAEKTKEDHPDQKFLQLQSKEGYIVLQLWISNNCIYRRLEKDGKNLAGVDYCNPKDDRQQFTLVFPKSLEETPPKVPDDISNTTPTHKDAPSTTPQAEKPPNKSSTNEKTDIRTADRAEPDIFENFEYQDPIFLDSSSTNSIPKETTEKPHTPKEENTNPVNKIDRGQEHLFTPESYKPLNKPNASTPHPSVDNCPIGKENDITPEKAPSTDTQTPSNTNKL